MPRSIPSIAPAHGPDATINLPYTLPGRRRDPLAYVRLLTGARRESNRWIFAGRYYRSGATVSLADIPRPGVALELIRRTVRSGPRKRSEYIYVLWRLDRGEWREMIRTVSTACEWAWIIGPVARRLLTTAPIEERQALAVEELLAAVERAILDVDPELRSMVCAGVEERLAAARVAA